MQLGQLLSQLGATHHHGRVQIMCELGRRSQTEPEVAQLLARLHEKGPYLRFMALFASQVAGDAAAMARAAAGDPSRALRRMALRAAARLCDQRQLFELLDQFADKPRRKLLVFLQRAGRQAMVDAWLNSQTAPPLELLAYGGPELLEQHTARFVERASDLDWRRLARRQPAWAAAHALAGGRSALRATLHQLARQRHRAALELWQQALEADHAGRELPEAELFASCPEDATRWALGFERQPDWPFGNQARRLPIELCRQLLGRGWMEPRWAWWRDLPLETRASLYQEFRDQLTNTHGGISPLWLQRLPMELRQEEARRQSQLPAHEMDPRQQTEYLSMLAFEEARQALLPLLGSPDVDERALGLAALTRIGRYQPERREEILLLLATRANEADPVRAAFLNELANLPPKAWNKEHFRALGEILKALLAAADGSPYSYQCAERLVLRILPFQPAWSAAWMGKLLRHWGRVSNAHWQLYLEAKGSAEALEEELDVLVAEWLARERFEACWNLFRALGRQLLRLPRLLARCAEICHHPQAEPAGIALRILLEQARPAAYGVIPALLAEDASWIEIEGVRDFLRAHRQDLLEPYLGGQIMQGKFASGRTGWVVHFRGSFWTFTPDQQARYAQLLGGLLSQSDRDFPSLRTCLGQLSRLPAVPPVVLQQHASLTETRQAVRDEALRCLARVDGGQGVDFLLGAIDDERARIAIYALRRALLEMPAQEAMERLLAINSPKLTVQKEVARLLGDLPHAIALPHLLERLQGTLQRDVRIATLRALWPHLDHEEVWPYLEEAARSEEAAFGQALAAIPEARHGAAARARLGRLLLSLLAHPAGRVRLAVLTRFSATPPRQDAEAILAAVRQRLDSEQEGQLAAAVLYQALKSDIEAWTRLLREQLPSRAALKRLVETMQYRVYRQESMKPLILATLAALQEDPATLLLWLSLLAYSRPAEELLKAVEQEVLSDPGAWDIPLQWANLLRLQTYRLNHDQYQQIWERWSQQVDPRLRRLCLEALLIHAQSFGWTTENRWKLGQFQNDGAALVKGRADFIFPPPL